MVCYVVYSIFTFVFFYGLLFYVLFNMLVLVFLGFELESIMGLICMFYLMIFLVMSNVIIYFFIVVVMVYNFFYYYDNFMNECVMGFFGILFLLIVMEMSLSGI